MVSKKDIFLGTLFSRYMWGVERILTCFLVLLHKKEPASKWQDQKPLNQVAKPPAEIATAVAPSKANDTTQGQAEAKKNKRERKEERQKKRKKEKKELKLGNHQEKSKSQKSKKRKVRPEAEQAAGGAGAPEATGPAGNKSQGPRSAGKEETNTGKRKRKISEGVWRMLQGLFKWSCSELGVYKIC